MRFELLVEQRLLDINRLIVLLKGHGSHDAGFFLESLKNGATTEWWPSLRALQTALYRSASSPKHVIFRDVARQWTALGTLLDLDEEDECRRHQREAAHRCSWYACAYHRAPPGPTITLKKCAGCGENRYCSRECQNK